MVRFGLPGVRLAGGIEADLVWGVVPEPSMCALAGLGALGFVLHRRCKKARAAA